MKRALVLAPIVISLFTAHSNAQVLQYSPQACAIWWTLQEVPVFVWEGGSRLPINAVCCNPGNEPFGGDCRASKPTSGTSAQVADDSCTTCPTVPAPNNTPPAVGKPINLMTGNTWIMESDISVPGLGGGLQLSRVWNSRLPSDQASYPFMFGSRWRSTFEERLVLVGSDGYVKYLRADGSVWSFGVTNGLLRGVRCFLVRQKRAR